MTENIQSAAVSDRGLSEKRPQNEDSYLEIPASGIFAVADGVGGAQAGDVASQMAVEVLQEAFANLPPGGDVEDMMKAAIEQANSSIFQMSHDLPQLSTMATTVVALHVDGNIATIGHVGDSRLYRVDADGNLFRETQDHSVVEEEVRAGRMTTAQAANHPSRNVISRALGADAAVEIDLKTIMFEPNTTFLLCSDGITRHIEDEEIRQLLGSENAPAQICEDMKHICYGRGAEDNLTAVIVRATSPMTHAATDHEEATVAVARAPIASASTFAETDSDTSAMPTKNLVMPALNADSTMQSIETTQNLEMPMQTVESYAPENFETATAAEAAQPFISQNDNASEIVKEDSTQTAPASLTESPHVERIETARVEPEKTGSSFGKLLSSLLLILIGAGLGAGIYHIWKQGQVQAPTVVQQPETPRITQMQTPNIAYSAFEDNRRNVDKNPAQFIAANGATADDAEDGYLLGRAYLLTGDYVKARENFTKAKELLPKLDGENKAMLANEINFGLSIVDSGYSRRFLDTTRNDSGSMQNQSNTANVAPDTEIKPLNSNANANSAMPNAVDN